MPFSWWVRPDRTARHERGSAPRRVLTSGESAGSGVAASSRSALLFRLSTTALVAVNVRSRWRCSSRRVSSSSLASCRVSANSAWSWLGSRLRRMRRNPRRSNSRPITRSSTVKPTNMPMATAALVAARVWSAFASPSSFRISWFRCALTGW